MSAGFLDAIFLQQPRPGYFTPSHVLCPQRHAVRSQNACQLLTDNDKLQTQQLPKINTNIPNPLSSEVHIYVSSKERIYSIETESKYRVIWLMLHDKVIVLGLTRGKL